MRDVEPDVYHYDALTHALERLGEPIDRTVMTQLCGDQQWVADGGILLFYTSVFPRHQFKYASARGYRVRLLDAGHLSQTVYLLAAALGLRMTFIAALRDEMVEDLLGLDLAEEFVVGCAVIVAPV